MVDAQLSTRLEDYIQKTFRSYTAKFEKNDKDEKKRKDTSISLRNRTQRTLRWTGQSYKLDKDLFESYGKAYSLKRDRKDKDKDEDPSAGSDQGLKRRKTRKDVEPSKDLKTSSSKSTKSQPKSSGKSAQAKESVFETVDTEMPQNQGSDLGNTDDQPNVEAAYKKLGLIDNLTQEHLVGSAFNLLKGICRSRVELEYHFKEYRGRQVVPVNYFVNNDLEYLKGGSSSRKYTTSTTKTKAAKYDDIQGIERGGLNKCLAILLERKEKDGKRYAASLSSKEALQSGKRCHFRLECGIADVYQTCGQLAALCKKVNEELGEICWWERLQRRLQTA
ncbi:hypothetical protein Tco_0643267 [Tanacetum coccineum]